MSYADELYKKTCRDILENGFSDENLEVRPHWADGTPAHTIKKFGVVNRYNLAEEFPIMTLRRTYWKSAVDELMIAGMTAMVIVGMNEQGSAKTVWQKL